MSPQCIILRKINQRQTKENLHYLLVESEVNLIKQKVETRVLRAERWRIREMLLKNDTGCRISTVQKVILANSIVYSFFRGLLWNAHIVSVHKKGNYIRVIDMLASLIMVSISLHICIKIIAVHLKCVQFSFMKFNKILKRKDSLWDWLILILI